MVKTIESLNNIKNAIILFKKLGITYLFLYVIYKSTGLCFLYLKQRF